MGKALTDFAMQAGQQALGAGLGLILGKAADKRQLKQQGKLQELEMSGQKQMAEYNYGLEMRKWNDTGYSAQMKQLEEAGLNPAMIYGMSGGGGQSSQTKGGDVSGGRAPVGGGEAVAMAGQAAQLGLLRAQKKNIEADTANKKADTPNKPLLGENIKADTDNKVQITKNAKVQEEILKYEQALKKIDVNVAQQTESDRMSNIRSLAEIAASTAEAVERDNMIAEDTRENKVQQIKAESIGAILRNSLTEAQTGAIGTGIKQKAEEIAQGWKKLDQSQKALTLDAFMNSLEEDKGYQWNIGGKAVNYEYKTEIKKTIQKILDGKR